jgi:hypothetical protein
MTEKEKKWKLHNKNSLHEFIVMTPQGRGKILIKNFNLAPFPSPLTLFSLPDTKFSYKYK